MCYTKPLFCIVHSPKLRQCDRPNCFCPRYGGLVENILAKLKNLDVDRAARVARGEPLTFKSPVTAVWESDRTWTAPRSSTPTDNTPMRTPSKHEQAALTSATWFNDSELELLTMHRNYETWDEFRAQSMLFPVPRYPHYDVGTLVRVSPTHPDAASMDDMELGMDVLSLISLDDPFHHPDVVAPGLAHGHRNSRLIGMVTRHGGHIGWTRLSEDHLCKLDYGFVGEVSISLCLPPHRFL